MNTSGLIEYFAAEKSAAVLLLGLALMAVLLSAYLLYTGNPFQSMAWVLLPIAILQASVGTGLLVRTPGQVASLRAGLSEEPKATVAREQQRMHKVNRSWLPIKLVELFLILLGLVLVFWAGLGAVSRGVGMGLLLQASVMLAFDIFAERRALEYTAWLAKL